MQPDLINIFRNAAVDVLQHECGGEVVTGPVRTLSSAQTSDEVTVLIGISGDVRGMVLIGLSEATARGIVSRMMGEPCARFDELAQSGIAELGNVITGRATRGLESAGYGVNISPPGLIVGGPGVIVSTVNIRRFVVPLRTPVGDVTLHAAIEIAPSLGLRRVQRSMFNVHSTSVALST